jgi:hypothetical protein
MSRVGDDTKNVHTPASLPPEPDPCPEGFVPVHQLCENCTQFFNNWEYLEWFLTKDVDEWTMQSDKWYNLCTVGHLLRSRKSCHFCIMLHGSLLKHGRDSRWNAKGDQGSTPKQRSDGTPQEEDFEGSPKADNAHIILSHRSPEIEPPDYEHQSYLYCWIKEEHEEGEHKEYKYEESEYEEYEYEESGYRENEYRENEYRENEYRENNEEDDDDDVVVKIGEMEPLTQEALFFDYFDSKSQFS